MATGSNSTANVSLGKGVQGGYIYAADTDVTLPTTYSEELASDWECLGYISEDGISESPDEDYTEFSDMNGDLILKELGSSSRSFTLQLVETKASTLAQYFGDDCVTDANGVITVTEMSGKRVHKAYVFDLLLTGDRRYRIIVPNGLVTETGEITYSSGDVVAYELTIDALLDDSSVRTYRYLESTETEAA